MSSIYYAGDPEATGERAEQAIARMEQQAAAAAQERVGALLQQGSLYERALAAYRQRAEEQAAAAAREAEQRAAEQAARQQQVLQRARALAARLVGEQEAATWQWEVKQVGYKLAAMTELHGVVITYAEGAQRLSANSAIQRACGHLDHISRYIDTLADLGELYAGEVAPDTPTCYDCDSTAGLRSDEEPAAEVELADTPWQWDGTLHDLTGREVVVEVTAPDGSTYLPGVLEQITWDGEAPVYLTIRGEQEDGRAALRQVIPWGVIQRLTPRQPLPSCTGDELLAHLRTHHLWRTGDDPGDPERYHAYAHRSDVGTLLEMAHRHEPATTTD